MFGLFRKDLNKDPKSPMYKWIDEGYDPEAKFPWGHVFKCKILEDFDIAKYGLSSRYPVKILCPACEDEFQALTNRQVLTSDEEQEIHNRMITVDFRSPSSTWRNLCGKAGYLFICTKHKKQIFFEVLVIN